MAHLTAAALLVAAGVLLAGCAAGGSGSEGDGCPAGQSQCDGRCIDTSSDAANCGACNNVCADGLVCDGTGTCSATCPDGGTVCDGLCVDTDINSQHCGGCGNTCRASEACNAGVCEDDSCTEASSEAREIVLPADIIIAVDNSSSMTDEAGFVQANLNDFAATITGSEIGAHVILISSDIEDEQGICVPAPLGSGACPDDQNLPAFRHVETAVGSSNALQRILDTYAEWQPSLRPDAIKIIAVITDDDSDLAGADFTSQLVALDPTFEGFKFDAIIAPYDLDEEVCAPCATGPDCAACDPCCGMDSSAGLACTALPADDGVVYRELIAQTGGVEGNLCTQDFLPVFQDMATAVITDARVACTYDIPDPDDGSEVDYTRVNVEYQPGPAADGEIIPHVPDGEAACGPGGGWYYDTAAPPTQVLLCPATCTEVQGNLEARISVKFGCATVVD